VLAHGALTQARSVLSSLVVRPDRMARNLAISEGLIASEAVMMRLARDLGRQRAHDVVYKACMAAFDGDGTVRHALLTLEHVSNAISADELESLLDPRNYTGLAGAFVDRVLSMPGRSE
jgi:3-carboxy-cis,cis-muconate cycloisomerase